MSYATPSASDLSVFLGADADESRATLLIGMAEKLCTSVVNPLPDGAEAVVLAVASRAFSNPVNATSQATGPYLMSYGAVGGGMWLTKRDEVTLRRMAGGGGAFTIDPTPADAGAGDYWAQVPETLGESQAADYRGNWDWPA